MPDAREYFIIDLSRTRVSESVVFWREGRDGYTVDYDDAGRYSEEEAKRVASNRDKDNIAVPVEAIPATALIRIFRISMLGFVREIAAALEAHRG